MLIKFKFHDYILYFCLQISWTSYAVLIHNALNLNGTGDKIKYNKKVVAICQNFMALDLDCYIAARGHFEIAIRV